VRGGIKDVFQADQELPFVIAVSRSPEQGEGDQRERGNPFIYQ